MRLQRERGRVLDDSELREFVRDDYPRLVNAVAMVTGSFASAEDAVQEALARAWIKSERGETIASLPDWVAVVAFNLSRSRWRRVLAERRATALLPGRAPQMPSEDFVDVTRALAILPRRQREVAVMRYLLEMSTREVAQATGVGEGTVKNSLSKARAALAKQLDVVDEEVADDAEGR